jgi:hypothetical protein
MAATISPMIRLIKTTAVGPMNRLVAVAIMNDTSRRTDVVTTTAETEKPDDPH